MKKPSKLQIGGTTLAETLVAFLLLAAFFASVFELNAVCLRYIDATKESVAALQHVQDRAETLRNLSFADLTTTGSVQTLMAAPPNAAPFAQKATETVSISAFPTPPPSSSASPPRWPPGCRSWTASCPAGDSRAAN